jgi:mRNA interferase MazF
MADPRRGDVWLIDLGLTAKRRPCLILSVPAGEADRALITVVVHTTSVRGTAYEIEVKSRFLRPGAFDTQDIITISRAKTIRRLGALTPDQLADVVGGVRRWLAL